jgi:REP element-mobilizing transposase RayT
MEVPRRNRLPHDVPQWVHEGSFFFISVNCQPRGKNHIARAGVSDAILAAAAYNHEHLVWHCRLMLLMPDHLHAVIAFPRVSGMKPIMKHWKHFIATHQKVSWQRDFFDHRLRNHHEEMEKVSYILMNPVRRGLCERAEDWPWVYRPADRPPPNLGG